MAADQESLEQFSASTKGPNLEIGMFYIPFH